MTGRRRLLSIDRALLAALLLIGAALFAFFKLASEVGEGETMALDRAILIGLRNPASPAGPRWLTEAMTETTAFGSVTGLFLVTSAVIGYLLISRRHRTALFVLLATGSGTGAAKLLKLLYDRPRPSLVPHLVDVSSASFPSGHSADSAIVYLTIAALLARTVPERALRLYILGVAGLLVVLIGVSRIYLGVHWPSDVVAGWTFGAAWALGCSFAYSRLWARQGLPEVEKR